MSGLGGAGTGPGQGDMARPDQRSIRICPPCATSGSVSLPWN